MRHSFAGSGLMLAGLALVGCSQVHNQQEATGQDAKPASDRIAALSPAWQRATLLQAIDDNGQNCDQVTSARYQQQGRGMARWAAECHDGGHWAIYVGAKAFAQVARCSELAASGLPACQVPELPAPANSSGHA